MRALIWAALFWGAASGAWASEDLARRLAEVLRIAEVVDILRDEGLAYGDSMDRDMLGGTGGVYFRDQVAVIYRAEDMVAALTDAMAQHMTAQALRDSLTYFQSDTGQRVIGLEISARSAFGDPDVEAMAVDRLKALAEDDPARRMVADYVAANDLIERNVDGIQATDFSFYLGLVDSGAAERDDDGYLAGLLEDRDALRAETGEWAMSFHLLAYHPLSAAEQQANIDFSRSAAGQQFNDALFEGFDAMYGEIFYRLGRLVGSAMRATDL